MRQDEVDLIGWEELEIKTPSRRCKLEVPLEVPLHPLEIDTREVGFLVVLKAMGAALARMINGDGMTEGISES
jgi:hypothetical protein